jgi:hypothetical protein
MRRGSGEADVAPDQFLAGELVGTGADRLDETEFLRAVEKALRPNRDITKRRQFFKACALRTAKLLMPVSRAENCSCMPK